MPDVEAGGDVAAGRLSGLLQRQAAVDAVEAFVCPVCADGSDRRVLQRASALNDQK
jgi:hypothetical protein